MRKHYISTITLIFFTSVFLSPSFSHAQSSISGTVIDETGEPLTGANVIIKGTTTGSVTDLDGNFKITLPDDRSEITLVVSFLGYSKKEVPVNGASVLNISLLPDIRQLGEVVVTAFGVEQEKKAINYSVQEVETKDIMDSGQDNIVSALQGKVTGVQITNTSGSPGASSSIIIRGASSINEGTDNQPLFVVDGIPISNSASFGGSNRAFDINTNDVASMTVLKPGPAAALYGIAAANGAIIITTKSAEAGKTTVNFSSGVSIDRALRPSPRQMKFTQGNLGVFDDESTSNWGPQVLPNQKVYDNVDNFLQYGIRQKYDLSVAGGTETASGYISGNFLDHTGIFPGERLSRYGILLKGTVKLSDKLSVTSSANLINTDNTRTGFGTMANVYRWPINDDMSNYLNPDGSKRFLIDRPEGEEWRNLENPYWKAENNPLTDDIQRIIITNTVSWKITENLKFTYRFGGDFTNHFYRRIISPGSTGDAIEFAGAMAETERSSKILTSTALMQYDKTFFDKFQVSALLGHNFQKDYGRNTTISGTGFRNPTFSNINNLQNFEPPSQSIGQREIIGAFSDLKVDYNGMVSLGLTGRYDWSSSLAVDKNPFFYPSASLGVVFTEFFDRNKILSFGKLRASVSQTAKDPSPHRLASTVEGYNTINGGVKYDYFAGNPDLEPEFTSNWEVGADLRFFEGALGLDLTYYESNTNDILLSSRVSPASGWVQLLFNAGSIQNKGVELAITYDMPSILLNSEELRWNIMANISGNRSQVSALPSFVSRLPVTPGQVISAAKPTSFLGQPLFAIEGSTYLYNEFGQLVVDEDGRPRFGNYLKDADDNYVLNDDGTRQIDGNSVYLGNREPKAIIGVTNSLNYKNFNLSFLFDIRVGGVVLNAAQASMIGNGSAEYLEEYRNKTTLFKGVVETEGGFAENTQETVLDQSYFNNYIGVGSNFVEDASWTRLRYVTLRYDLPQTWASKIGSKNLSFSVTGRNLALWTKYSGGDPETNYAGAGVGGVGTIGLDYFNVPTTQGIDLTLNATF